MFLLVSTARFKNLNVCSIKQGGFYMSDEPREFKLLKSEEIDFLVSREESSDSELDGIFVDDGE